MSENTNVFMEASKKKLRFVHSTGLVTTEDLWDLPLAKLDEMAVALDAGIVGERKSFRTNPDRKAAAMEAENKLRLEVIVQVIKTKEDENARKAAAADKKARLEFLTKLKEKRELDQLEAMDLESIQKEIDALQEA